MLVFAIRVATRPGAPPSVIPAERRRIAAARALRLAAEHDKMVLRTHGPLNLAKICTYCGLSGCVHTVAASGDGRIEGALIGPTASSAAGKMSNAYCAHCYSVWKF